MSRDLDISREYPVRFAEDGLPLCRGCGEKLPHKRRRWCGGDCQERAYVHCYQNSARWAVEQRDQGVCAECGVDTKATERIRRRARWRGGRFWWRVERALGQSLRDGFTLDRSNWDMDHRVPLWAGGGRDLGNCQTLCKPCHKAKTKREAARRAAAKKGQLVITL